MAKKRAPEEHVSIEAAAKLLGTNSTTVRSLLNGGWFNSKTGERGGKPCRLLLREQVKAIAEKKVEVQGPLNLAELVKMGEVHEVMRLGPAQERFREARIRWLIAPGTGTLLVRGDLTGRAVEKQKLFKAPSVPEPRTVLAREMYAAWSRDKLLGQLDVYEARIDRLLESRRAARVAENKKKERLQEAGIKRLFQRREALLEALQSHGIGYNELAGGLVDRDGNRVKTWPPR